MKNKEVELADKQQEIIELARHMIIKYVSDNFKGKVEADLVKEKLSQVDVQYADLKALDSQTKRFSNKRNQ